MNFLLLKEILHAKHWGILHTKHWAPLYWWANLFQVSHSHSMTMILICILSSSYSFGKAMKLKCMFEQCMPVLRSFCNVRAVVNSCWSNHTVLALTVTSHCHGHGFSWIGEWITVSCWKSAVSHSPASVWYCADQSTWVHLMQESLVFRRAGQLATLLAAPSPLCEHGNALQTGRTTPHRSGALESN